MKKFISIIFLVILLVTLTACNASKELDINKLEKSTYNTSQKSTNVTLSVREKIITSETESITLIYSNHSDGEYMYGKELHLEVEVNGIWYVVPTLKNVAWSAVGYILSPNDIREDTFSFKYNYGQLNAGKYRIVKTLSLKIGSEQYSEISPGGEPIFSIAEFQIQ
jgi:hypothetical protein